MKIREKISTKKGKVALLIAIVSIASVAFAISMMTKTGRAQIMTGPPGPYYVTAEAMINGPRVDLAAIQSKVGGAITQDYVQWGSNPFYRVYTDNTLQEVYYGQMRDVMDQFSWNFALETNIRNTFNDLKNNGALDPSSMLGELQYFGNLPGTFIAIYHWVGGGYPYSNTLLINTTSVNWYSVSGRVDTGVVSVDLNGNSVLSTSTSAWNALGGSGGTPLSEWKIAYTIGSYIVHYPGTFIQWTEYIPGDVGVTIYTANAPYIEKPETNILRIYTIIDSPGTGFALKKTVPATPIAGSTMDVIVTVDPPAANVISITDSFPSDFTLVDNKVVITRYSGVSAPESVEVILTPSSTGFTVDSTQAPVLASLASIQWFTVQYKLRVPSTTGTYTLPEATITYEVPP